ncbi:MAG: hypothetical protein KR126chlam1_00809 [Chlamydiae bacterium]|nr:hypothetical protein [Chlamydiota bacterium]
MSKPGGNTMSKATKVGLSLLLVGGALGAVSFLAPEGTVFSQVTKEPLIFSKAEGIEWIKKYLEEYPELKWLADENVRKTEEGSEALGGSYSEQLFGKKFVEFDRTMMTLTCMRYILDGSDDAYNKFTAAQRENKLSRESFQQLHEQGLEILDSRWGGMSKKQIALAMETALVLGDIGKSERAREFFKEYSVIAPDHDDFHGELLPLLQTKPGLCPSFARLPSAGQKLLTLTANLGHFGHMTHLEGGSGMFDKLIESGVPSSFPNALSFDLFVHKCDVAGAAGHVNNSSSLVYTENTFQAMEAVEEAIGSLSDSKKTGWDAYNAYLTKRAEWLGLKADVSGDRVLTRIGAMLRLFTPEEGNVLREAMGQLDTEMQERIAAQLDVQKESSDGRTPTYMPAVLVNLMNNQALGKTEEERLSHAITLGLPFISRVLEEQNDRLAKGKADTQIPLCFNAAAGAAKTNPGLLKGPFSIDNEGMVRLGE